MKIKPIKKNCSKKLLAIGIILFCSVPIFSISVTSMQNVENTVNTKVLYEGEKDLYLLRVEHYLYVNASNDVGVFHIRFSFPPDYAYQVPLMLELYNDSSLSGIVHYRIENDTLPPNKIINFTLNPMKKGDSVEFEID